MKKWSKCEFIHILVSEFFFLKLKVKQIWIVKENECKWEKKAGKNIILSNIKEISSFICNILIEANRNE